MQKAFVSRGYFIAMSNELNLEKKYLDEDKKIWVIENFLTDEEIAWFREKIDDPNHWYITMRSPYNNILNKFLDIEPEYDQNGKLKFPDENSKRIELPIFSKDDGIWSRLFKVLPPTYKCHATLQTFKYMPEEEINKNLNEELLKGYKADKNNIDFAMYWHADTEAVTFSFSLYLNDDFEGGELEFLDPPIKIKPKAGMLVGVPPGEEYTHRVNKVLGPNSRHTLYGNSWPDISKAMVSTAEDC